MSVSSRSFGITRDGSKVIAHTIENSAGASFTVLNYGATLQSLLIPDRTGRLVDTVLGYDSIKDYEAATCYVGATVGRVCNRIGGASFSLNGTEYKLFKNDGANHLHGGACGFDRKIWQADCYESTVVFSRFSPHGEEGYPGNLQVAVSYTLSDDCCLSIAYRAETDMDTIVNLTNHSYFNLAGRGLVLDHELQVFADYITETDEHSIPTGRLLEVSGTPFDFRKSKAIGRDIDNEHRQLRFAGGYDHNFVLHGKKAAVLLCRESGIKLTVLTQCPGMQVYTANFLKGPDGKNAAPMLRRGAVCLETQLFPDAPAHYGFPSTVLHAGESLSSETKLCFTTVTQP